MILNYQSLQVHRWMLRDWQRMDAFNRALRERVQPGMVVLDVGAGSGVLSLMAARHGAARVYAVESTPVARLARKLAQRNGFAHVIRVLEDKIQNVRLPEPVDLIVSEWLGTIGVDENLLYPVLLARDRWLKPDGVMLPAVVHARLAPAQLALRCDIDFLQSKPFGLELSDLTEYSVHELLSRRYQVRPSDLACTPKTLWTTNTNDAHAQSALQPNETELAFELVQPRRINAFVAWFEAELSPDCTLSNGPAAPETHWGQLTLPLQEALELPAGSRVQVRVASIPRVPGVSDLAWAMRVNDGPWQSHDTRAVVANTATESSQFGPTTYPQPRRQPHA